MRREEDEIYLAVSNYLQFTYPSLLFRFDYGAGATLFWKQAVFQKKIQKGRAWPDLFIAAPTYSLDEFNATRHGMFLEVKPKGFKLYKKDGLTAVNEHVWEQIARVALLNTAGYWAEFGFGTEDCISKIDKYLLKTPYKKRGSWKQ